MTAGHMGSALLLLCVLAAAGGHDGVPTGPPHLRAALLAGRPRATVVNADDGTDWKGKYERLAALFRKRVGEDPGPLEGHSLGASGLVGSKDTSEMEEEAAPPPPSAEMLKDLHATTKTLKVSRSTIGNERMEALVAGREEGTVERYRAEYMMASFKFLPEDAKEHYNITQWEEDLMREDAVMTDLRQFLISISALGDGRWTEPPTYTTAGRTVCLYFGVGCFHARRLHFFNWKNHRTPIYGISSISLTPAALPVGSMAQGDVDHILDLISRLKNLRSLRLEGLTVSRLESAPFSRMRLHSLRIVNCQHVKTLPQREIKEQQSLRLLQLSDVGIDALRRDLFEATPSLRVVVLHQLKITAMPHVAHLKRLKRLLLSDLQHLRALPPLAGNASLESLIVSWVPVRDLFDGIETVASLVTLEVTNTQLRALPEGIGLLQNLRKIVLSSNRLETVPESLYKLPVERLRLNSNALLSLPEGISLMASLRDLNVASNRLEKLPDDIWSARSIRNIVARSNRLKTLPVVDPARHHNEFLVEVDLAHNKLTEVPPISARAWPIIVGIDLSNNNIGGPVEFEGRMNHLMRLHMNGNPIGRFGRSWQDLRLTHLDLTECGLSEVPDYVGSYKFMKQLLLQRNRITSLPASIGDLQGLETLYLNENLLAALPESMSRLRRMRNIFLHRNRLATWPDLSASPLQRLNLDHNLLKEIPDSISQYSKLVSFHVQNNQLARVSPQIGRLSNVRIIALKQNRLKSVPNSISSLVKLRELDISFNEIEEIGSFVNGLSGLRVLRADHNSIASIMTSRMEVPLLKTLDLSHNRLTSLPGWDSRLRVLNVEWNQLHSLPADINMDVLTTLRVAHNHIHAVPDSLLYGSRASGGMDVMEVGKLHDGGEAVADLSFNNIKTLPPRRGRRLRFSSVSLVANPLDHVAGEFVIPDGSRLAFDSAFALSQLRQSGLPSEDTDSKPGASLESTGGMRMLNVTTEQLQRVFGRMLGHDEGWESDARPASASGQGAGGGRGAIVLESSTPPQLDTMTTECWQVTLRAGDRRVTVRGCGCAAGTYFTPHEALHLMAWMPAAELGPRCVPCPSGGACKHGAIRCDAGTYLRWGAGGDEGGVDPADRGREGILVAGGGRGEAPARGKGSGGDGDAETARALCEACPPGAKCRDNTVAPLRGYWRNDVMPTLIYECKTPAACEGGAESTCRAGHHGSLCNICDPGHFKAGSGLCEQCASRVSSVFYIVVVTLGAAGFLCILVFLGDGMVRQLAVDQSIEALPTSGAISTGGAFSGVRLDELAAAICRIVISFTQVVALLPRIYSVDWGSWLQYVTSLFSFLSLDIISPSSFECAVESDTTQLDYFISTAVYGVTPIAVAVIGAVTYLVFTVVRRVIAPAAGVLPRFVSAFLCKAVVLCWLFAYLPIALTMMEFFTCRTFDAGDTYWITADVATQCYTGTWYALVPFVIFVVVYFILGLPLLIFVLMFPWPRDLGSPWVNRLRDRMDRAPLCILFRRMFALYRVKFQWWDALEMLRKLLITAAALHFAGVPTVRVLVSIMVTFGAVVAQVACRPFEHRVLNLLQSIQLVLLYLTLSLGILKAVRLEGHGRSAMMAVVVACDVIFILGLLLAVAVYLVYQLSTRLTHKRIGALRRVLARSRSGF